MASPRQHCAAFAGALGVVMPRPSSDERPTLSEDGRTLVFSSTRGGNADLWYAFRDCN